ncbi:methionyl-tRNA formyltransferase [Anaerobacillus isosaccharinicus]|uniref:Methionyl-tRNA formyltransferase n=1 Tax=Anaerobacillus isosaccharinicus TaxID=1532552 RepID=A0A1S2L701_9BACI|nr:methionyl-tRNA formyltransferase [Anaerobacillus isosaccharinicus]MBA5587393.1 methionyl-tRNA formyltransferase [Anaerobacillus isosaccharinicus]QOY34416.1 methionyl-tRNA formyltransferase [Anaerobacillus isosaccharinicus]
MRVVFMGTPDFSVPVLRRLIEEGYEIVGVVTQPDRPKGRKKELTPPPVKVEAVNHGLPIIQPEKLKRPEDLQQVLDLQPDLVITAAFGQILPKQLLDTPKFGCINVHASLLPEYRGGAPIHQAIVDGKKETGITIMYMVEKLDAGDILTQAKVNIEEEDHVGSLHNKLSVIGAELLSHTIPNLIAGKLTPIKQEDEKVTFAPNISREKEKINWAANGEAIYNQIRGLHPWPVAYTLLNDQPLKVWWAQKVSKQNGDHSPGTIVAIESDGFIVSTGNETYIKVTDLQPSGKKRMLAEQFLRGATEDLTVGTKLGE